MKIDFNKEIIQLTLLQEFHQGQGRQRRDLNSEENLALNLTKIVVQDYKNVSVANSRFKFSLQFILIFSSFLANENFLPMWTQLMVVPFAWNYRDFSDSPFVDSVETFESLW